MINIVYNSDCLPAMQKMEDKQFDLAIVDPPYGIGDKLYFGGGSHTKNKSKFGNLYSESGKKWDIRPKKDYFKELFRISINQIICGANYSVEKIPVSRGWIFWDKMGDGMSSVNNELIFTSFDISIKTFRRCHGLDKGFMNKEGVNIHPTQKPVALYKWLLKNYAKEGNTILDTHVGSGSSRIACYEMGFSFEGYEIDKDYWEAQEKRFKIVKNQIKIF